MSSEVRYYIIQNRVFTELEEAVRKIYAWAVAEGADLAEVREEISRYDEELTDAWDSRAEEAAS